jgi:hypothetical protein
MGVWDGFKVFEKMELWYGNGGVVYIRDVIKVWN